VTALTLGFGVLAAVVWVAAYLRLYRRQKPGNSVPDSQEQGEDPNDKDPHPRK
jgi:hypothetical protein